MLQSSSVTCARVSSIVNRKMSYYTQSGHLISNHVTVILYIVRGLVFSVWVRMPSTFPVSILGPFNRGWMCHVTCVVRCLNHEVTSHDLLLALGQVPGW